MIALGSKFKFKKSVQGKKIWNYLNLGIKPVFPISLKKYQISEIRGSRERSHRRSKHKKNKWKNSPYKKKLASKIQKLKHLISETPNNMKRSIHNRKSNVKINEYSNFINGQKKYKTNCKF